MLLLWRPTHHQWCKLCTCCHYNYNRNIKSFNNSSGTLYQNLVTSNMSYKTCKILNLNNHLKVSSPYGAESWCWRQSSFSVFSVRLGIPSRSFSIFHIGKRYEDLLNLHHLKRLVGWCYWIANVHPGSLLKVGFKWGKEIAWKGCILKNLEQCVRGIRNF